jgi:hypothetical protein
MNILLVLLHASLVFRSAPTSSEKINNDILDKLAYFGDFRGVTRYLQHHKGVDWSKACCSQSRTAIHYALQGRMDAINRNDFAGQHEVFASFKIVCDVAKSDVIEFSAAIRVDWQHLTMNASSLI